MTMLMYAAGNARSPEFLEAILKNGAKIGATDNIGRNVFHFACKAGRQDMVKFLQSKVTEDDEEEEHYNAQTTSGVTPLMLAVDSMNYDLIVDCLNNSYNPFFYDCF